VFVSPSNHRVHHGQNDYCIDRNYGGILILWDRMFGSFVDERDGEKIIYGIRKPLHSFNPLWGNLHYYADLWRESMAAQGLRAKLAVWITPPGGWHDEGVAHFEPAGFERYTTNTPAPLRWYATLQYTIALPFIVHLIAIGDRLEIIPLSLYALGIFATVMSVGAVLQGGKFSRRLEQMRVLALGAAFFLTPNWFGFDAPLVLRCVVLALAIGSAVWLSAARSISASGAAA
jgi:hypothetical protein